MVNGTVNLGTKTEFLKIYQGNFEIQLATNANNVKTQNVVL